MTSRQEPSPDDRAAAVARAANLVEREDAETRHAIARPARRRPMAMIAAWVLFAVNVVAWVVFPPPPLDAGDQRAPDAIQRDLRLAIATTAAEVDGWRALNSSRLPPTLEAAGMSERAFEYSVVDSVTFDLAGSDGGVRLSYRSSTPLVDFLTAGAAVRP